MNRLTMLLVAGSTAFAVPAFAQAPAAPAPAAPAAPAAAAPAAVPPGVYCGGPAAANTLVPANDVSQCEVHKVIADAANSIQLLRNRQLLFGIHPRTVMVGIGTVVDLENPAAPTLQNARWEYSPDYRLAAARWDIRAGGKIVDPNPTGPRIIHVVKGDKAWDESGAPGLNPTDVTAANIVAMRKVLVWVSPHAILRAAGFTSKGLCPTGGTVAAPAKCPDNKVSVEGTKTINLTLSGVNYKVTLDAQNRPGTIETMLNGMPLVTTYSGYRDGKGMSGGKNPGAELVNTNRGDTLDELAFATDVLDKYRYGTYYPGRIVQTLGGKTVLDVQIMAGYTNKYVVFPDPAVVRAAGPVPK